MTKEELMAAEQLRLRLLKADFNKEPPKPARLEGNISVPRTASDLNGRLAFLGFIFAGLM